MDDTQAGNAAAATLASKALEPHLAGCVPPSQKVAACLAAMLKEPVPNEPNTAAQGSKRVVPGVWLGAYGWQHGLTSPVTEDRWATFIAQEEAWRALSTGGPVKPVALGDDGEAIVNASGKPVPVTLCDAQHFELLPHLFTASLDPDGEGVALTAWQQTSELLDWAADWAETKAPKESNPRALGWMLTKAGEAARVFGTVDHADDRPLRVAKAVVQRLAETQGEQNGMPYLVLNPAGAFQKDHGYCRWSFWMNATIVHGLAIWLDVLAAEWAVPFSFKAKVRKQYLHGLRALRYGMELAEAHGAPLGGAVDDADPDPAGKFHVHTDGAGAPKWDGVMLAFALPALLSAEDHAPQHWEFFGPRALAYYERADRFRFNPAKPLAMDQHSASVAIMAAGHFGWREV